MAALVLSAISTCLAQVNVTISPTGTQTITLGQSIQYSSNATDSSGQMEAHSFEWQDPDGYWSWEANASGMDLDRARTTWFNPTSSSSLSIVATPTRTGTFHVKWMALSQGTWTSSSIYQLVVTSATAPSITSHPQGATKNTGFDVGFGVTASGATPLTYQWRKNGNNISGATNQTLILYNIATSDAGGYSVVVTNSAGSATSNSATLTVNDPSADANSNSIPDMTDQALGTNASSSTNDSSNTQQQNVHRPNS